MTVSHFPLGSIQSVLLSVSQRDWLASFDLREAYLPVPVHPASRHLLRFLLRDTVYQFQALCFGLSTAPQVFTWIMSPVSAILHSLGIRMRRYLDTWLVQYSSQESLLEDLLTVLRIVTFGVCHPSQEVQPHTFPGSAVSVDHHRFHLFQGFSVGGTHLTAAIYSRRFSVMRLAYRKPVAVASRRSFLAGSPRSWQLTGDVVPPALPPSFLVPSGSGGSTVSVDDVSSSSPVLAPSPLSVSRGSLRRVSPDLHFWSDTSAVGWGAHLDCQVASVLWDPRQTALSINAGELLAIQLGLFQFRSALQGRTVAVFCDTTSAVPSLRKEGGTWSPLLNTLAQAILRWKESLSIRLAPQFLLGSDTVLADALSRPHQLPHPEWSLHMTVFLSLRQLWPVQIVFFATSATHRCSIYFSPFRDPRSAGTDAFLQSWDGLQAYAFHPVAVIPRILAKLRASRGRNSLLWLPTGLSALGFRTWSSSRWLLQ